MSKKNEYSKLFGTKSSLDFDVKKSKKKAAKAGDIFYVSSKKNKKKGKKKNKKSGKTNIKKIVRRTVGVEDDDLSILKDLFVWSEEKEVDHIKNFYDLSKNARGVFVVKIKVDEGSSAFIPVCVNSKGEVVHTESGDPIEKVFAKFTSESSEITDTDIDLATETLTNSDIIECIYNVDMFKLINCIGNYGSIEALIEEF